MAIPKERLQALARGFGVKILGITLLLLAVLIVAGIGNFRAFSSPLNVNDNLTLIGFVGILGIGVAFVIITGGIDLSIGSVLALIGVLLPMMLVEWGYSVWFTIPVLLMLALTIGLVHGLLITQLNLQPFVVTLCGLMIYRSVARWIGNDTSQGYGTGFDELRQLSLGGLELFGGYVIPWPLVVMILLGIVSAIFLNLTIYGRYLLALGRNEQAARYSGINTKALVVAAYVICSGFAGIGAILFALFIDSVQPATHGNFYELYAIAAAVLGGCSLRGGEGSILGVIIGAAVMRFLANANTLLGGSNSLEPLIIGLALLIAVLSDEFLRRIFARRRRAADAKRLTEGAG